MDNSHRIKTEVDLSPMVIHYWQGQGFCVHGEVAVYGKSIFIDHVAHLGPCASPTYVVAIEMKKGVNKSLWNQLQTIDCRHLSDEVWGIAIATPRQKTLQKWYDREETRNPWIEAGIMSWDGESLVQHRHSRVTLRSYHRRYFRKNDHQLLLIEENKGALAGFSSADKGHDYVTHWSASLDWIKRWAKQHKSFTTNDLYGSLPDIMNPYRKKRSAMNRMLRHLETQGVLRKDGKKGRCNKYAVVQ